MKAYITSIGEPTTSLCQWSLNRLGFKTILIENKDTLAEKLEWIYKNADEDFLRVDADVIVNKNLNIRSYDSRLSWIQFRTFDMYKLEVTNGGVQLYTKEIIPILRRKIGDYSHDSRPETRMWRLEEFKDRRKFVTYEEIVGIHGFGQKDIDRVMKVKNDRKEVERYDWELVQKMQEFYKV